MCTSKKSFSLWTKSIIRYIHSAIVRTSIKNLKNSTQKYLVSTLNGTSLQKNRVLKGYGLLNVFRVTNLSSGYTHKREYKNLLRPKN